MTSATVGREPIQIVEIKQPFCTRTYGVAPCTASGTADEKCYNTRKTCQDVPNFDLGSLSLYFSSGEVAAREVSGATYILPFLQSVSTVPTKVNLAGSSPDASGIGTRELLTITMVDSQHTDERVDPYLAGRSWDPLAKERGTFWTRWLARNPYRQNIEVIVYEGYSGQALGDMVKRTYFLDSIQGPRGGAVTLQCKDVLARAEERKAQAPLASPGFLAADIGAGDLTLTAANAVEADYAASGYVRIGDEIILYSSRAASGSSVVFSGLNRAQFNTTAEEHDADSTVQQCLVFLDARPIDVVQTLLVTYARIDASWLDFSNWEIEFNDYLINFLVSAVITEPTSVVQLISELCEQCGFFIWWDARESLVKFRAIRGEDSDPDVISEENHIIADTFSITEHPRERVSQVWFYYNQRDYVKSVTDVSAYESQFLLADLDVETDEVYGEAQVRKIFGRWVNRDVQARVTSSRILINYSETPNRCAFEMDAKDRQYWVGDVVAIDHWLDRDEFGEKQTRRWTIVTAQEVVPGHRVRYTALDTTKYGDVYFITANGIGDYTSGLFAARNWFLTDDDGLNPDGSQGVLLA